MHQPSMHLYVKLVSHPYPRVSHLYHGQDIYLSHELHCMCSQELVQWFSKHACMVSYSFISLILLPSLMFVMSVIMMDASYCYLTIATCNSYTLSFARWLMFSVCTLALVIRCSLIQMIMMRKLPVHVHDCMLITVFVRSPLIHL